MAAKAKARTKGVQPGGANIRVPRRAGKPRKPTPRHPTVNPGGPAIGLTPPVAPAPRTARKKTAARKKPVKRGAALGDAVPCCAAEALAASLRLTGQPVSDGDVLALHLRAGGNLFSGVYLEDVLSAAATYGLGGVRLDDAGEVADAQIHDPACSSLREWCISDAQIHSSPCGPLQRWRVSRAGLILGIDQPGPHTVFDDGEHWWSWGEPWEPFAGAVISEAWCLSWGSA
jgi:hypothetical protein